MKKYICIKGSPEIPKGSEATTYSNKSGETDKYSIYFKEYFVGLVEDWSIEQNDCWEEVKEETPIPVKRWKPEYGEGYWYYIIDGNIISDHWEGTMLDNKMYSVGNIFRTEKEAKAEVMRMKSRAGRWDFVPTSTKSYYVWNIEDEKVYENSHRGDTYDTALWNIGNCHRSREDAEKWGETYAKYFIPPQY